MSKEIYCGECKNLLYEDACGYGSARSMVINATAEICAT